MHYYTQLLSVILICFLSLSSPHTCSSPCGLFCTLSLFPLQSLLYKNEKEGKKPQLKTAICLSPSCLPAVHIYCYFVPKGRINLCGENPKLLELSRALISFSQIWSLTKALSPGEISQRPRLISHPDGQLQDAVKESLAEICSSCSRLKLQQKRRQERVCHSLGFWYIE